MTKNRFDASERNREVEGAEERVELRYNLRRIRASHKPWMYLDNWSLFHFDDERCKMTSIDGVNGGRTLCSGKY